MLNKWPAAHVEKEPASGRKVQMRLYLLIGGHQHSQVEYSMYDSPGRLDFFGQQGVRGKPGRENIDLSAVSHSVKIFSCADQPYENYSRTNILGQGKYGLLLHFSKKVNKSNVSLASGIPPTSAQFDSTPQAILEHLPGSPEHD